MDDDVESNFGEEPDDEFFDTFFDDGALETIGRVWNDSKDDVSNDSPSTNNVGRRAEDQESSINCTDEHSSLGENLLPKVMGVTSCKSKTILNEVLEVNQMSSSRSHNSVRNESSSTNDLSKTIYLMSDKLTLGKEKYSLKNRESSQTLLREEELRMTLSGAKDVCSSSSKFNIGTDKPSTSSSKAKFDNVPPLGHKQSAPPESNIENKGMRQSTKEELSLGELGCDDIKKINHLHTVDRCKIQLNLKSKSSSQLSPGSEDPKLCVLFGYGNTPGAKMLETAVVSVNDPSNIPPVGAVGMEGESSIETSLSPGCDATSKTEVGSLSQNLIIPDTEALLATLEDGEVLSPVDVSSLSCLPSLEDGEVQSADETSNASTLDLLNPSSQETGKGTSLDEIPLVSPCVLGNVPLQRFQKVLPCEESSSPISYQNDKEKSPAVIRLASVIIPNLSEELDGKENEQNSSKKKKRKKSSKSRSTKSKKKVKARALSGIESTCKSSKKSPKSIRPDSPGEGKKRKASRERKISPRAKSRSGSPTQLERTSKTHSRYKHYFSKNAFCTSRSSSRSPARKYRKRLSKSPRRRRSTRSRSSSLSPIRRRSSRHLRSSPHASSRSPTYTKSRSSRSRSRSPFINEIRRLEQKWAEEDNAKKYQPPPPAFSQGDTMFLPPVPSWNTETVHRVSISVESVRAESTSFSINDVFHAPTPPIGYTGICPPPRMGLVPPNPGLAFSMPVTDFPPAANVSTSFLHSSAPSFQPLSDNPHIILPTYIVPPPRSCVGTFAQSSEGTGLSSGSGQPELLAPELRRQLAILTSSGVVSQQSETVQAVKQPPPAAELPILNIPFATMSTGLDIELENLPVTSPVNPRTDSCKTSDGRAFLCPSGKESEFSSISTKSPTKPVSQELIKVVANKQGLLLSSEKCDTPQEQVINDDKVKPTTQDQGTSASEHISVDCNAKCPPQSHNDGYDSDVVYVEAPKKPSPEIVLLSEDEVCETEQTEIYDLDTELNKIQKDLQKLESSQKKSKKASRKARRRKKNQVEKLPSLPDDGGKDVLKDCYDFIDSLRIGRFIVHEDENLEESKEKQWGTNSVLWKGSNRVLFSFTRPLPPEKVPSKRDVCTNTPSILTLDISTSTENVIIVHSFAQTDTSSCSSCSNHNDLTQQNEKLQLEVKNLIKERDALLKLLRSHRSVTASGPRDSINRINYEKPHASLTGPPPDCNQSIVQTNEISQVQPEKTATQKAVLAYDYHHSSSVPTEVSSRAAFHQFTTLQELLENKKEGCWKVRKF